jgi:hypothetical protein
MIQINGRNREIEGEMTNPSASPPVASSRLVSPLGAPQPDEQLKRLQNESGKRNASFQTRK